MSARRLAILLLVLFAVPALAGSAAWLFRDPLLNSLARPALEQALARRLGAEVALGRLVLEAGRLEAGPVTFRRDGTRGGVRKLALDFSFAGLRQRHLRQLTLTEPRLELTVPAAEGGGGETGAPFSWPDRPALGVGRVVVTGGSLEFHGTGSALRARALELVCDGRRRPECTLEGTLDGGRAVTVALAGNLAWRQGPRLILTGLTLDGESWLAEPVSLEPAAGLAGPLVLGVARLDRARLERLLAVAGTPLPLPEGLDFSFSNLRLVLRQTRPLALEATAARGTLRWRDLELPLREVAASLGETAAGWQGRGRLHLAGAGPLNFAVRRDKGGLRGEAAGRITDLAALKVRLLGEEPPPVAGGIAWDGRFRAGDGDPVVELALSGLSAAGGSPPDRLDLAPWEGTLHLAGDPENPRLEGGLQLDGQPFLAFSGGLAELAWTLEPIPLATLAGLLPAAGLPQFAGSLSARGRLTREAGSPWHLEFSAHGPHWQFAGWTLSDPRLAGRLTPQPAGFRLEGLAAHAALEGRGLHLPEVAARGSLRWQPGHWEANLGELRAEGGEFLSADGLRGFTGAHGRLEGRLEGAGGGLRFALAGRLGLAELLLGSYYAELGHLPAQVEAAGLDLTTLRVALPPAGRLQGQGSWSPDGRWRGRAELALEDLGSNFPEALRPAVRGLHPALATLEAAGGLTLRAGGEGEAERWWLEGEIVPAALDLALPEFSLDLRGLDGRLPWRLAGLGGGGNGEFAATASLACRSLRYGLLEGRDLALALRMTTNGLALADPVELALAGGRLRLGRLALERRPAGLFVGGHAALGGVSLETLTRELGSVPLGGSLDAELGDFEYLAGELLMAGEATIEAFGGRLTASNLRADDLFTSYRSFAADLEVRGLDLHRLTRTFDFGEINGILDGYVHDLKTFGAVPAAFTAAFETREKGQRNISVKALQNIAVLSQGGISAALSRGIYRFIDFYRYRRIGLFCALRNDVFLLKGTAREGSDRYLVYGGWLPPKIDILAPATSISFKEMLRRLERLDRAGKR